MTYWQYDCQFCEWFIVIPMPMLDFEIVRLLTFSLIDSHYEAHSGELLEAAEAIIGRAT